MKDLTINMLTWVTSPKEVKHTEGVQELGRVHPSICCVDM